MKQDGSWSDERAFASDRVGLFAGARDADAGAAHAVGAGRQRAGHPGADRRAVRGARVQHRLPHGLARPSTRRG